jgi:integrase
MHSRRHPKLRTKKGSYYADFYDPRRQPTRKWVALGTKNKRVAQRKLTRLEDDYLRGDFDPWTDPLQTRASLTEAIGAYVEHRDQKGYRAASTAQRQRVLERFARDLPPDLRVDQITTDQVRAFVLRGELAQWTKRTYYARLNTFFGFCVESGYQERNPCDDVDRPPEPKKSINYVTPAQLEQLCGAIEEEALNGGPDRRWYADVLRFTAGSGLRLGEVCALRWKDVDLDEGTVIVRSDEVHRTKTGEERTVYISPEAQAILRGIAGKRGTGGDTFVFQGPRLDRLSYPLVSRYFREYRREVGLSEDLTFHSLRKTYGTVLASAGVPLRTIQKMLGHSDITITARTYADVMSRAAREQIRVAFEK